MAVLHPHIRRALPLPSTKLHTFSKRGDHLGGGWVFLIIILLIAAVCGGVYGFWLYRRRSISAGANYPAPAPTGLKDWISDTISGFKRGRQQRSGAGYEPSGGGFLGGFGGGGGGGGGGGSRRGRGNALDPDEAWDARVGNEAYFEEQELGLHAPTTYTGAGYGGGYAGINETSPHVHDEEDEAKHRELDRRYDEEMHSGGAGASSSRGKGGKAEKGKTNPFDDRHAVGGGGGALRGVSPRPIDTSGGGHQSRGQGHGGEPDLDSPTERKSVFREEM